MKFKNLLCNSVMLGQLLGLLDDNQEILVVGRTGVRKTEIETVKYICKTEKLLLKQIVAGVSLKEGDTYLIIRLGKV